MAAIAASAVGYAWWAFLAATFGADACSDSEVIHDRMMLGPDLLAIYPTADRKASPADSAAP